jgi:hypothetical protein
MLWMKDWWMSSGRDTRVHKKFPFVGNDCGQLVIKKQKFFQHKNNHPFYNFTRQELHHERVLPGSGAFSVWLPRNLYKKRVPLYHLRQITKLSPRFFCHKFTRSYFESSREKTISRVCIVGCISTKRIFNFLWRLSSYYLRKERTTIKYSTPYV